MFWLESPNTVSSIFSICLTLLLALSGVEGGVFFYWNHENLFTGMCAFRSALDIAHVFTAAAFAVSKLFLSLVRIPLTCDCLFPAIGVGIFVRGLIILLFLLCLFHSSFHVLIWACLQKEEIFGSFHFTQ